MSEAEVECSLLDVIAPDDWVDYGDERRWPEWERRVAGPLLAAAGYRILRAYTAEGDSFGPLLRCFVAEKDGRCYRLYYG